MFLDLTSSTSIAEKLGHVRYYDFLNRFFNDISAAVLVSWGNIYQYVGDEVVVFWPADRNTESVRCFFMIKEKIESGRAYYESEFGLVPQFRAGIHGGQVSIGEIGTLKKDILFIGDVLNATSRIQGLCKEEDVDLLVSEDVLQPKFSLFEKKYKIRDTGQRDLRGKNERLRLFHLMPFD
jgi:adenylate cyclase